MSGRGLGSKRNYNQQDRKNNYSAATKFPGDFGKDFHGKSSYRDLSEIKLLVAVDATRQYDLTCDCWYECRPTAVGPNCREDSCLKPKAAVRGTDLLGCLDPSRLGGHSIARVFNCPQK